MNIISYEIINHGVNNSQYFQGCGTAFTEFDEVATGIGSTPGEALEDALDSLAQDGWETETVTDKLSDVSGIPSDAHEDCDLYHYVSVRVK